MKGILQHREQKYLLGLNYIFGVVYGFTERVLSVWLILKQIWVCS